jgi:hypothetical protein
MSIVSVHGPNTWGQPFLAQSEFIFINLLGEGRVEFKSPLRFDLADNDPDPYEWDFGDGSSRVNGYETTHTFDVPGVKTVRLRINTKNGVVEDSVSFTLPNGDGDVQAIPQPKRRRKAA